MRHPSGKKLTSAHFEDTENLARRTGRRNFFLHFSGEQGQVRGEHGVQITCKGSEAVAHDTHSALASHLPQLG